MKKINAVITGIGGYVPDYILTNDELSRMVDTTDEWITTRVGIKERRILKDKSLGVSFLGTKAVQELIEKTNINPIDVDAVICATSTSEYVFPAAAALIANNCGMKKAFAFDIQAACTGFLVALTNATGLIESRRYKKIVIVAAEKMSTIVDYTDRTTCPLFGDGAVAVLVEPTTENTGVIDSVLQSDGAGEPFLKLHSGASVYPASHETIDEKWHYIYQKGQAVFKYAVTNMSNASVAIMKRNKLTANELTWFIPHQANLRIIDAVAGRMKVGKEKIKINIEKYGNTSAVSILLCLWEMDNEKVLRKGDKIVISAFGAGFTWGAMYLIWGYDSK